MHYYWNAELAFLCSSILLISMTMNTSNAFAQLSQLPKTSSLTGSKLYVLHSFANCMQFVFLTKINNKLLSDCHKLPVEVFQPVYSATTFWKPDVSYTHE